MRSSIRVSGGQLPPSASFSCYIRPSSQSDLTYLTEDAILPDIVDGQVSYIFSVTAFNGLLKWSSVKDAKSSDPVIFLHFCLFRIRLSPLLITIFQKKKKKNNFN